MMVYQRIIKPIFFKLDPEDVHDRTTILGRALGSNPVTRSMVAAALRYEHPALVQTVAGVRFPNPVGLSAGFDKNVQLTDIMPAVGFGFEEVGSITNEPYAGNPKPRLVRLPKDNSIIVYYGLKNEGADALRKKLCDSKNRPKRFAIPIGISIAKTNKEFKSLNTKIDDWAKAVAKLQDCGDYLTINVSCPNTYDPLNYNDPCLIDPLLKRIAPIIKTTKPIFLKLSADIPEKQIDEIVKVCDKYTRTKIEKKDSKRANGKHASTEFRSTTASTSSSAAASLKRVAMQKNRTLLEDKNRIATRGARSETRRSSEQPASGREEEQAGNRFAQTGITRPDGKIPLITGFILTNLVKDRASVKLKSPKSAYTNFKGGLSGKPTAKKSLALTTYAYKHYGDRYVIIGVGGIFTAQDAYERIKAGASLVQLITGLIYGGPTTIKEINKGLVELLHKDGYENISEAVGRDVKRRPDSA
jgi:dihydroorotate dehydrogenase